MKLGFASAQRLLFTLPPSPSKACIAQSNALTASITITIRTMPVTRSQARSSAGHQLGDGQDPAQHSKGTSNLDKNPRQTTQSASKTSSNDASDHKVLQTGIVRFYTRGRMNIENPTEADEVARLYMVLDRALPASPHHPRPSLQGDDCCMLLIPKKTLPQKPGDRRMAFVDAPQTSLVALEKTLSFSDEHETKTAGLQHTPKAHMLGRGVYAIVASQKETLFGYVLTAPVDMVSEQNEADLDTSGTFIVSTRNPRFAAPKSVQLPKSPEYPKQYVLLLHQHSVTLITLHGTLLIKSV